MATAPPIMVPAKTRVLLVGSGGIGTIAALNLERGGQAEVTAVLRSNYDAVSRSGFTIKSCEHGELEGWRPKEVLRVVPNVSEMTNRQSFDYIVCCTKNIPDVGPSICDIIAPAVTPGQTAIVLIQNGLNIQNPFFQHFPFNVIISGVSRIDAHEVAPGIIEQRKADKLYIGAFKNHSASVKNQETAAQRFVEIYSSGGKTTCLYRANVDFDRWSKLVYNATLNPICAVTGLNTGDLQRMGRIMNTLVVPAMKEVVEVARAAGHVLPEGIVDETIQSNPIHENIAPSMQIDLQKGNFIEHENLLGEVVREAGNVHGMATPVLSMLYELCSALQWKMKQERDMN